MAATKITIKVSRQLNRRVIGHVVLIYLFLFTLFAHSSTDYAISPWSAARDLVQKTIFRIHTTEEGDLWFVTLNSIVKFDGIRISEYTNFDEGEGQITGNNILNLWEDEYGDLYIITENSGILIYDQSNDHFRSVAYESSIPQGQFIYSSTDVNGDLWIASSPGLAFRFTPTLGLSPIEEYDLPPSEPVAAFSKNTSSNNLAVSKQGSIYHLEKNEIQPISDNIFLTCQIPRGANISAISFKKPGELWIGTIDNGLHLLNLETSSCMQFLLPDDTKDSNRVATIHEIYNRTDTESTWIATDRGLFQVSSSSKIRHYHRGNSNLTDNWVISIAPAGDSMLWIGTFSGLDLMLPTKFLSFGVKHQPDLHSIVGMTSDESNHLWIATYNEVLVFDPQKQDIRSFEKLVPNAQIARNEFMSIAMDSSNLWLGYHANGVTQLTFSRSDDALQVNKFSNHISSESVSSIHISENGETLFGTYGGGLIIFNDEEQELSKFSVGDNKVIMLFEFKPGIIWIGTEAGLYKLNQNTRKIEKMAFMYEEPTNKSTPLIWIVRRSENGDIWLGTMRHGLYLWEKSSQDLNSYQLRSPLDDSINTPVRTIYSIEIDRMGDVWCSTDIGLIKYSQIDDFTSVFSSHYGLKNFEFEFSVSSQDSLGNIYFGGNGGFISFDPLAVREIKTVPNLRIIDVSVANLERFQAQSFLDQGEIVLTYDNYFVSFSMAVLDFIDPSKNQYRYKLEGFDPEWIENGNRNTATYTNLPPGDYVFQVQGANSAGIWNREGASLKVTVLPPPWLTWWAFCLYAIGFFGALGLGMRAYTINALKEKAIQQANEMQEAAERVEDELQEQQEFQDELITALHRHNVSTLALLEECYSNDPKGGRIHAMHLLERCYHHEGDALYADMRKFTDLVANFVLDEATCPTDNITTINAVDCHLLEAGVASPIAVVIYELLSNAVQHAFPESKDTNFIQVDLENTTDETSGERDYLLSVSVNGRGMDQENWSNPVPGSGIAVIQAMAENLGATLTLSADSGDTRVALQFPETPIQPH